MENTEKRDAMAVIDGLASEIHSEYMKAAAQVGQQIKSWEEIPDSARSMCRTLARLMLSKMEEVHFKTRDATLKEAKDAAPVVFPAPPAPARAPFDPSSLLG